MKSTFGVAGCIVLICTMLFVVRWTKNWAWSLCDHEPTVCLFRLDQFVSEFLDKTRNNRGIEISLKVFQGWLLWGEPQTVSVWKCFIGYGTYHLEMDHWVVEVEITRLWPETHRGYASWHGNVWRESAITTTLWIVLCHDSYQLCDCRSSNLTWSK
jgi:hypothetical protein